MYTDFRVVVIDREPLGYVWYVYIYMRVDYIII